MLNSKDTSLDVATSKYLADVRDTARRREKRV